VPIARSLPRSNPDSSHFLIVPGTSPKIRVFVVDDHPIVREAFRLLCAAEPGLTCCGEADGGPVALQQILALRPDVAVVDLGLKSGCGLDLIKQLRTQGLRLKILVYSMSAEPLIVERTLQAGADGYLTKEDGIYRLVDAIRAVMQGQRYVAASLMPAILARRFAAESDRQGINRLTDRELQVFEMLGAGLRTKAIAAKLNISAATVAAHRVHIKRRLGLRTFEELSSSASRWARGDSRQPKPAPE
jgi:DNA-binding NarL/FixJ family response regulator